MEPRREYLQVMDPMPPMNVAIMNRPVIVPGTINELPSSTYIRTSLNIDGTVIIIYAHAGINIVDAWQRLVHRYPNPQNEPSRIDTRNSTLGI
jgi:hypothetical protein